MSLHARRRRGSVCPMRLFASVTLVLVLSACPPAGRPCAADSDCAADEVCLVSAGAGACATVGPGNVDAGVVDAGVVDAGPFDDDAGERVDAGAPDAGTDAGVRDDGLALRGTLEIAPGGLSGGGKGLRGHVLGTGPANIVRGGTLVLDAALNGAAP